MAVYKELKQYGNVRSILEQKIKKESDPDEVSFQIGALIQRQINLSKRYKHEIDLAKANSIPKDIMDQLIKLQANIPAENKPIRVMCLVELAKVAIQLEKVDQAIEFANEAVSLGNKQVRLRTNVLKCSPSRFAKIRLPKPSPKSPPKDLSKEFLDTKLLLIKCHLMNEDESVALRLLNETQPSLELVYGLVSDESAKALEMSGSLELAKGNIEIAYHKLNNAYQVYQALDHKHKQVSNNR